MYWEKRQLLWHSYIPFDCNVLRKTSATVTFNCFPKTCQGDVFRLIHIKWTPNNQTHTTYTTWHTTYTPGNLIWHLIMHPGTPKVGFRTWGKAIFFVRERHDFVIFLLLFPSPIYMYTPQDTTNYTLHKHTHNTQHTTDRKTRSGVCVVALRDPAAQCDVNCVCVKSTP